MLKSNWSQIQAGPFNLNQWKMKFSANSIKTDQVEVNLESLEIQEQHDYIYPLARNFSSLHAWGPKKFAWPQLYTCLICYMFEFLGRLLQYNVNLTNQNFGCDLH